jgi:hypothetical protein
LISAQRIVPFLQRSTTKRGVSEVKSHPAADCDRFLNWRMSAPSIKASLAGFPKWVNVFRQQSEIGKRDGQANYRQDLYQRSRLVEQQ